MQLFRAGASIAEIEQMKRYLWHEMKGDERDAVEERYFSDDRYFAALVELDQRLVESYAGNDGAMTMAERQRLKRSLAFVPERRAQLARLQRRNGTRLLAAFASRWARRTRRFISQASPSPGQWAWAGAMAALVLLTGYLGYDARRARRELSEQLQQQTGRETPTTTRHPDSPTPQPGADSKYHIERASVRPTTAARKPKTTPTPATPPQRFRATPSPTKSKGTNNSESVAAVLEPAEGEGQNSVFASRGEAVYPEQGEAQTGKTAEVTLNGRQRGISLALMLPLRALEDGPFKVQLNGRGLAGKRIFAIGIGLIGVKINRTELRIGEVNEIKLHNREQRQVGSFAFKAVSR